MPNDHDKKYRNNLYKKYLSTIPNHVDKTKADKEALRFIKHSLKPYLPADNNARILELGCGSGLLLQAMQNCGYNSIYGVDISPEQVNLASKHGMTNVVCNNAATYMENANKSFDLIVMIDFLEHLTKDEAIKIINECARHLTPKGQILIRVPNGAAILGNYMQTCDFTHETAYSPRSLTQLLGSCGFTPVSFFSCSPIPDRPVSIIRWVVWHIWTIIQRLIWLIDTGTNGPPVLTPNLGCCAKLSLKKKS